LFGLGTPIVVFHETTGDNCGIVVR
jgi:hypothetical protein